MIRPPASPRTPSTDSSGLSASGSHDVKLFQSHSFSGDKIRGGRCFSHRAVKTNAHIQRSSVPHMYTYTSYMSDVSSVIYVSISSLWASISSHIGQRHVETRARKTTRTGTRRRNFHRRERSLARHLPRGNISCPTV